MERVLVLMVLCGRNHHMVEGKTTVSTSLLSLHCSRPPPQLLVYQVLNY
jgi:hypothetical protein